MINITDSTTGSCTTTIIYHNRIECEKCKGSGYQQRDDGIWVLCPICGGSGWRKSKSELKPYDVPFQPWYPMHPAPGRPYWYSDNTISING